MGHPRAPSGAASVPEVKPNVRRLSSAPWTPFSKAGIVHERLDPFEIEGMPTCLVFAMSCERESQHIAQREWLESVSKFSLSELSLS